jgi:hypothetical protein
MTIVLPKSQLCCDLLGTSRVCVCVCVCVCVFVADSSRPRARVWPYLCPSPYPHTLHLRDSLSRALTPFSVSLCHSCLTPTPPPYPSLHLKFPPSAANRASWLAMQQSEAASTTSPSAARVMQRRTTAVAAMLHATTAALQSEGVDVGDVVVVDATPSSS